MKIAVIGGGINGLCCAWELAKHGHRVTLYEKNQLMRATSCKSSKLLHGGLRYLENFEFRLVKEALKERNDWIKRVPELAKPLRLILPVYKNSGRSIWLIRLGLFIYDNLNFKRVLPKSVFLKKDEVIRRDPNLCKKKLLGGFEFSDGQMDDYALGMWVVEQCKKSEVKIHENTPIDKVSTEGVVSLGCQNEKFDYVVNVAGPWALDLLARSHLKTDYALDLVRGSHLVLEGNCRQAYLLPVPNEKRIFFVLPWKGNTLVGTTEVRQDLNQNQNVTCSEVEEKYLISAYRYYFPNQKIKVIEKFAGLRPLIKSAEDPGKATREYEIITRDRLITVLGGKWTTSLALARNVVKKINHLAPKS